MDATVRVRTVAWFATAIVLSILTTLLVTQAWTADAAPGDTDATFVPVTPCRLFDYRPGELPADGKKTPLAAGSPATQQVTGTVGNCAVPGTGVIGVAMNVTVVDGTAQSNLRLYPADAAEPLVSNTNWKAGDSATANKVDVKLSPAGVIKLANFNGTVNVIGDIVGYYTNSTLKELAAGLADANNKIAALEGLNTGPRLDTLEASEPFIVTAKAGVGITDVTTTPTNYVTVEVTAPVAGQVTVNSYATVRHTGLDGSGVVCKILESTESNGSYNATNDYVQWFQNEGAATVGTLNGTRTFHLAAGETKTYGLRCQEWTNDGGSIRSRILTAIFTPTP